MEYVSESDKHSKSTDVDKSLGREKEKEKENDSSKKKSAAETSSLSSATNLFSTAKSNDYPVDVVGRIDSVTGAISIKNFCAGCYGVHFPPLCPVDRDDDDTSADVEKSLEREKEKEKGKETSSSDTARAEVREKWPGGEYKANYVPWPGPTLSMKTSGSTATDERKVELDRDAATSIATTTNVTASAAIVTEKTQKLAEYLDFLGGHSRTWVFEDLKDSANTIQKEKYKPQPDVIAHTGDATHGGDGTDDDGDDMPDFSDGPAGSEFNSSILFDAFTSLCFFSCKRWWRHQCLKCFWLRARRY